MVIIVNEIFLITPSYYETNMNFSIQKYTQEND